MHISPSMIFALLALIAFFIVPFFIKSYPPGYGYAEEARNNKICWAIFSLAISFTLIAFFLEMKTA